MVKISVPWIKSAKNELNLFWIEDREMYCYTTAHYLNEKVQKTTFEKHNLNKFDATKIFIGEICIAPS